MNRFTRIHSKRPGRHHPLLLVLLGVLTFLSHAFGAAFQPNDEVRLTRESPLLFLDKPLRQGTTGETFKVLAHQPEQKKVFLAAKDPAGKEIAVSVAEDSVSLVPADKAKVQADMLAAVSRQQYAVARGILFQALRGSPDDADLHSASIALEALVKQAAQLNQATINQKTVAADLQRQRHNADVTDHSNPLDARDNSGRQRATQMRAEANRVETESNQALRTAQANYDAALSALKTTTQRQVSKSTDQASGKTANAQQIPRDESLKQWIDDEPVVPTTIIESDPGFQETIDFLNGKLGPLRQKLWFGKAAQKLIIEDYDGVVLIDPKDLSPTVIHGSYGDQSGRHCYVELKTTNSQDKFQFLWKFGRPPTIAHRMSIKCEDEFDAKKVANAFSHLVLMFGGKDDSF